MAIHPQVRVAVRPYGSVVPLGFLAFGIGMFMYAALDAEWVKPTEAPTVGLMLVAFVAPLEGLAAIIAFLARDTLAGVALALFTGSWLMTGFATMQQQPGQLSAAQGYFLIAFTTAILLLACVAWLGQPLIAALLTVACARGISAAITSSAAARAGTTSRAGSHSPSSAWRCTAASRSCSRMRRALPSCR
jgi:hypothetical protein